MIRGRNHPCRWLCPCCAVLRFAEDVSGSDGDNHRRIRLVCTHTRPEILPSKAGCVSIEDAARGTRLSWLLFPATMDGDRTVSLDRERWIA
jgi:hypothetical protein